MNDKYKIIDRAGIVQGYLSDDAAKRKWEAQNPTRLKLWGWRIVLADIETR